MTCNLLTRITTDRNAGRTTSPDAVDCPCVDCAAFRCRAVRVPPHWYPLTFAMGREGRGQAEWCARMLHRAAHWSHDGEQVFEL